MRAEVIGIGTEILLGQIANTNAQAISQRLAEIGVDVLHHQVVGDNVERIADAFRRAAERADVVIATGGLGPTGDDVTREGLAAFLGVGTEYHPEIEEHLRQKFRRYGREMPESNLRQCEVPTGARYVLPERGTAPGLVAEAGGAVVYVVPGVPEEMREMLEGAVVPELVERAGEATIASRTLRAVGLPEARVAELLEDLFERSENPTVAYLASAGEVRVRLTAKAGTGEEARRLIAPAEEEVRRRLGDAVFGVDDEVLEAVIGRMLVERGLRLGCAESLTGGSLGARLTDVPGASEWFRGSVVAYSNEAKERLLGVAAETLERAGAVSEACAREMAAGARRALDAEVGLALTGVAGPDPQEGEAPGTIWMAVSGEGGDEARRFVAPGDRAGVRRWAVQAGLILLRRYLLER